MSTSPKRVEPPKADDTWLSPKNDISHLIAEVTPDKYEDCGDPMCNGHYGRCNRKPTPDKVEEIDIAIANLLFAGLSIAQMEKIPKWLLENIETNKSTFRTTVTQYHQDLMSEAVEAERKEWLSGNRCGLCGGDNLDSKGLSDVCEKCFEEQ